MAQKEFKMDTSTRKEYFYFIHQRNYEKDNKLIYKIGRTHDLERRLNKYPKNSVIHKVVRVSNCYYTETKLINTFHMNFSHRADVGREYFEGDSSNMLKCMDILIDELDQRIEDNEINDVLIQYYGRRHRIIVGGKVHDEVNASNKIKVLKRVIKENKVVRNGEDINDIKYDSRNFSCKVCGKEFKSRDNLKYHVRNKVCVDKKYSCKFCGNRFNSDISMYRHIRQSCKMKGNSNENKNESEPETENNENKDLRNICNIMQNQIKNLQKQIDGLKSEKNDKRSNARRPGTKRKRMAKVRRLRSDD